MLESNGTRPRDIERALARQLDRDRQRHDLQQAAAAHVRVQRLIDQRYAAGEAEQRTSADFIRWIHRELFADASETMLRIESEGSAGYRMVPGEFRQRVEKDNLVGRHQPPSSAVVDAFMQYFERQFRMTDRGPAARVAQVVVAHHRFNYIHPFPDGHGRVSRLLSHAMAWQAGIGAHGPWSISRGLSRGLPERPSYKAMMDATDAP